MYENPTTEREAGLRQHISHQFTMVGYPTLSHFSPVGVSLYSICIVFVDCIENVCTVYVQHLHNIILKPNLVSRRMKRRYRHSPGMASLIWWLMRLMADSDGCRASLGKAGLSWAVGQPNTSQTRCSSTGRYNPGNGTWGRRRRACV